MSKRHAKKPETEAAAPIDETRTSGYAHVEEGALEDGYVSEIAASLEENPVPAEVLDAPETFGEKLASETPGLTAATEGLAGHALAIGERHPEEDIISVGATDAGDEPEAPAEETQPEPETLAPRKRALSLKVIGTYPTAARALAAMEEAGEGAMTKPYLNQYRVYGWV